MSLLVERVGGKLRLSGTTDPLATAGIVVLTSASGREVQVPVLPVFDIVLGIADGYYAYYLLSILENSTLKSDTNYIRMSCGAFRALALSQYDFFVNKGADYTITQILLDQGENYLSSNNPLGFERNLYEASALAGRNRKSTLPDQSW